MTNETNLLGCNWIGSAESCLGIKKFQARNPQTGEPFGTSFSEATSEEVEAAAILAESAFLRFSGMTGSERAQFLTQIAVEMECDSERILRLANLETALPIARLEGEMKRTTGQLRMFAELNSNSKWQHAIVETAIPERAPIPKPDLRRMLVSIGPVAVFGSSNFPLAYSVAGGDTASALAAGSPVIVKAHPAHPQTSELVAGCVLRAAQKTGMPNGVFSMLHGGNEVGGQLVQNRLLKGVGFTGSQRGGRALFDLAAARPEPIPVFAEMGSINPVFAFATAFESNAEAFAKSYAASLTLGVGQFCTNPGVFVAIEGPKLAEWMEALRAAVQDSKGTMLTPEIGRAYCMGAQKLASNPDVKVLQAANNSGEAGVYQCSAETFVNAHGLHEEVFGPAALIVVCRSSDEMHQVASSIDGQLTASIHGDPSEIPASFIQTLSRKVGRLIFNGWPTGVEVCDAMTHGGPYPASTDCRFSAVGTTSISRWLRPITYQNWPKELLPVELQ